MSETPLQDGDYLLSEGAAWFTLKGFSVRLVGTDDGVVVNIYANGREMDDALATAQAFDSEVEEAVATEDRALVEAAPDLLACLLDVLDADGDLNAMDFDRYRAAIAKAKKEILEHKV